MLSAIHPVDGASIQAHRAVDTESLSAGSATGGLTTLLRQSFDIERW